MMSAHPELRIEIRDFGVFEVKRTRSKPKARNPKSGEIIYVPPRRKTHFKPSKLLRKFLAQPLEDPEQTKQQDSGRARQS
jgi:integration host factor subunit beta